MNVVEFNKKFEKFEKDVVKKIPDLFIAAKAGFDIAATVSERVIQRSLSGDNTPFSPYSTRPMLTSGTTAKSKRVWNAKAGSKAKRRNLDWVTLRKGGKNVHLFELPGGYAELRRLEGFSNRNKNFWFTTQMWRGFGFKRAERLGAGFKIIYGGRNSESQEKIDLNSEREGKPIIDMTQKEADDISKRIAQFIEQEFSKI